jgi:hypothetical protein
MKTIRFENEQLPKRKPLRESASELYQPSDRRLWATLVPTFVDIECHVVSVTDPYGRILGSLDRASASFLQVNLGLKPHARRYPEV